MAIVVASSSPSSSSSVMIKNEVFVSFRGDTRKNFTSHLYDALCRKHIQTYRDAENLERGDEISPVLLRAIEESMISIVVFSKEYASSRWCLDELVHILKCKEERGQIVLPIFYAIDPSDIRKQKGSYGDAFVEHEQRLENDKNKLKEWRDALTDKNKLKEWRDALTAAANLSGFHSQENEYESKLIEKIVEDVLRKLNRLPQVVLDAKGFVGLDVRVKKIESLLCFGSPNPRVIGLWGIGGVGKTTLARAVFERFFYQFESCCFLENVREDSQKHGLPYLESKLFSKLLKDGNLETVHNFVKNRLHNKMVLIIYDDIDDIMQLERLFGDGSWFGPTSKIIITTRDAQILRKVADEIYEVKSLDSKKALELFYLNAFKTKPAAPRYIQLSKEIVNFTRGNPLALKVLGSSLHSKSIDYWEGAWSRLKIIPNPKIQKVLKISYDGLEDKQQDILLDIACFLKGERRDFIESILDDCDLFAKSRIEDLIDKSLVTIIDGDDGDRVWMHDLIQEMGWEIVREQSIKNLGKRSRLWIPQDVYDVLDKNEGTKEIEGIFFDISKLNDDLHLKPTVFNGMYNMRLLKIYVSKFCDHNKFKVHLCRPLQSLPQSLRYLCWYNYPLKSLPSDFKGKYLVELDMPCSELKQLWGSVQNLANLKSINLGYSKQLTKVPDLSQAPKLESVNLEGCTSLVEVPPLNFQGRFGSLTLRGCSKIKYLPKISGNLTCLDVADTMIKELPLSFTYFGNLVQMSLQGCQHVKNLPALPRNIEILNVSNTSIKQVSSSSIEGLPHLRQFYLQKCKNLESLPTNIFKLSSLLKLDLRGCSRLKNLTETPFNLKGTEIQELRCSFMIKKLFRLRREDISWRKKLHFIPNWVYNLSSLILLSRHNRCLKAEHLQIRIFNKRSSNFLNLYGCNIVEIPEWLGHFSWLYELDLGGNHFEKIPSSIRKLHGLANLLIKNCKKLRSLPQLPLSIRKLNASGCTSLATISSSSSGFALRHLISEERSIYNLELLFGKCWKLEGNARSELTDFLHRVEGPMIRSRLYDIKICYPGHEIPKWFRHQAGGIESISMKLPKNWLNSNFLGFAFCFVSPSIHAFHSFKDYYAYLRLELNLKTSSGQIHTFYLSMHHQPWLINLDDCATDEEEETKITGLSSDHVFIRCWSDYYLKENEKEASGVEEYGDAIEASFDFKYAGLEQNFSLEVDESFNLIVKRLGVELVYRKEGITTLH